MISGLSLTIRDKRPTPRELFWRVAFLVCLQQIAHRAKYGETGLLFSVVPTIGDIAIFITLLSSFSSASPLKNPFSLFYAAQILT